MWKGYYISTIKVILQNEVYVGDMIFQKTYCPDFLSKRRKNNGEEKKWYVKDNHDAIIPREQFDRVQNIIKS